MKNEQMTSEEMWSAVDEALRTSPLAPAPVTLRPRVMARLRALAPAPRFRLHFIDYAISLFGALMMAVGILLVQSISPQAAALAQLEVRYLGQVIAFSTVRLGPALGLGATLALLAGVAGIIVLGRGRSQAVQS